MLGRAMVPEKLSGGLDGDVVLAGACATPPILSKLPLGWVAVGLINVIGRIIASATITAANETAPTSHNLLDLSFSINVILFGGLDGLGILEMLDVLDMPMVLSNSVGCSIFLPS